MRKKDRTEVVKLTDAHDIHRLRQGDADALARIFKRYAPYVATVAHNIIGSCMAYEDVEEVVSDVFAALWRNAEKAEPAKLKAYLGSIARNKAKDKLRERIDALPLEEDSITLPHYELESEVFREAERAAVEASVLALNEPDREIFLRHYYGIQTAGRIAADMGMSESAVKKRLIRGREKLRLALCQYLGEEQ